VIEQVDSSAAFNPTVQLDMLDIENAMTKPRSFNAIIEENCSNNLLFTIIIEERTGQYRLAIQKKRPEKSTR
jgi:hypothetical protein